MRDFIVRIAGDVNLRGSENIQRDVLEHLFDNDHYIFEVDVGLIELKQRELGLCRLLTPSFPKDSADLVDLRDVSTNDPLQIQLQGDSKMNIDLVCVVVGHEGAAQSRRPQLPAGSGLDFQIAFGGPRTDALPK